MRDTRGQDSATATVVSDERSFPSNLASYAAEQIGAKKPLPIASAILCPDIKSLINEAHLLKLPAVLIEFPYAPKPLAKDLSDYRDLMIAEGFRPLPKLRTYRKDPIVEKVVSSQIWVLKIEPKP